MFEVPFFPVRILHFILFYFCLLKKSSPKRITFSFFPD